jgi:hypothetical protein
MRAGLVALVVASTATIARADDSADKLFQKGRRQLDAKDYKAACDTFAAAFKLDPRAPGTMLNLGLCSERLHHYTAALKWYRRAASRATELHMDPEYVKAADAHTIELAAKVATVRVDIKTEPAPRDMVVKIDGEQYDALELNEVALDPGAHVLVAKASGMKLVRKDFDVITTAPNQHVDVVFEEGDSFIVIDRGRTRRRAAIITGAGGGALMAIAGIYAKVISDKYKTVTTQYGPNNTFGYAPPCFDASGRATVGADGRCGGGSNKLAPAPGSPYALAAGYHQDLVVWGNALFFTGVAAVLAAGVVYFTAPSVERHDALVLAPVVAPDQVGVAAIGRF